MRAVAARADGPDTDTDTNPDTDADTDANTNTGANPDTFPNTNAFTDTNPGAHADANAGTCADGIGAARGRCLSRRRRSGRDGMADGAALAVARVAQIHAAAEPLTRRGGEPVRKLQAQLIFRVCRRGGVKHRQEVAP